MSEQAAALPLPTNLTDQERVEHTRLRRRVLYGRHKDDVAARIRKNVQSDRATKWGEPDLTCNLLSASADALSALYARRGAADHEDAGSLAAIEASLVESGYWAMMSRVQRDTIAMREHILRPYLSSTGEMRIRRVWADMVEGESSHDEPEQFAKISELRERELAGKKIWTREVIDLRDSKRPAWQVFHAGSGDNLSHLFLETADGKPAPKGGLVGDAYDLRDGGRPVMPYVCYHAERTGQLFDPWSWQEILEGTLSVSVLWTFFMHAIKNASWPQRWINGKVMARNASGEVVVDPAALLILAGQEEGQPVQAGAFPVGADPKTINESISDYERRVAALAGLNPADISRVSGDPRSGYALSVTRSGQREAQRKFKPVFEEADKRLFGVMGLLKGKAASGYRIRYGAIPKSLDEMRADLEFVERMRGQGLMTQRQAVHHMYPDWESKQVDEHLALIQAESAGQKTQQEDAA